MKCEILYRTSLRILTLIYILTSAIGHVTLISAEEMPKSEKFIFTTVAYPVEWSETNTLLLVESIRNFAGSHSQVPIWCFVPRYEKQCSEIFKERLAELNVTLIPFEIDHEVLRFFFAADIHAAALAESMAIGKSDILVWLSNNTVILQEPKNFLLPEDKNLGYRPVHHINVGSSYDMPLDPFWALVYQYCKVPEERVFPMVTHVGGERIRPYFNAGILVTRPEKQLLRAWCDTFFEVYQKTNFRKFYEQDERYVIFVHQAILSGVILTTFGTEEILELPHTYNYPVHLYEEDVTDHRPSSLEKVVTFRHEGFYRDPKWMEKMPANEALKQWLGDKLPK